MSNKKIDDCPAFPVSDQGTHGCYGMSLRDYFAGKAMVGLMSCNERHSTGDYTPEKVAISSYNLADAMLKAREKCGE